MDELILAIIFLTGIAFFLYARLKADYIKRSQGKVGEKIVAKKLKAWLGSRRNYIFNDITLRTQQGTTQIDHLVICTRGIFCIETKLLNGFIKGNKDDLYWLHKNRKGGSNSIYNPLKQNAGHIKHISKILGVSTEGITGYVVNVGEAKIRGDINPFLFGKSPIEKGTGFVFRIWLKPKNVYSQEQVEQLVQLLDRHKLKSGRKANAEHLKNIKRLKR